MTKKLIAQHVVVVNIKMGLEKLVAKTAQLVDIEQLIQQMITKIGMAPRMEIIME